MEEKNQVYFTKEKIYLSIFCMLIMPLCLIAQVKTEKYRNGQIAKQYSFDKDGNYHGAYTEWSYGGKVVIKKNYLHGELHGNYVEYFDNGQPHIEIVYHKGTETNYKEWDYYDGKRYLKRSYTQTNDGKLLTAGMKMHYNEDWIETAGLLPNGRWSLAGLSKNAEYTERYNGNDTLYVWSDRTKKQFRGKDIDGKGYIYEWDKNGNILKSPEKDLADKLEKARLDSIATENRLVEELRIKEKTKAKEDTIISLKQNYENAVELYKKNDLLYTEALKKHVVSQDEQTLCLFLYNYLTKKKKKQVEIKLQEMIIDVLGEQPNGYFSTYSNNGSNLESHVRKMLSNIKHEYSKAPYIPNDKTREEVMIEIEYDKYVKIKSAYTVPEKHKSVFDKQTKLVAIMEYCKENKIAIK